MHNRTDMPCSSSYGFVLLLWDRHSHRVAGKPSGYLPEAEKERQGAACWAGEARPHPDMFLDTQVKIRQYSLPVILLIRKNNAQERLGD